MISNRATTLFEQNPMAVVQTKVDTWPVQTEFKTKNEFAKDRKLQIYEACLNELSPDGGARDATCDSGDAHIARVCRSRWPH
jgi:hypothetical protein